MVADTNTGRQEHPPSPSIPKSPVSDIGPPNA